MISIVHYLYRKSRQSAIAVLVATLLFSGFATAQLRDRTQKAPDPDQNETKINTKKDKRGPRAIAVMEFLPGGAARLVPIALWIDGRYYDASLYGANPEPMALEPETLYEVMDKGEPTGWFTVTAPRQDNGNWIGDGRFKPQQGALDAKVAAQAAKQPKPKPKASVADDEGPPVLRRPSSGASNSSPGGNAGSSPSSDSSHPATSSNAPPAGDEDLDRPTLKKPQQEPTPAPAANNPNAAANSSGNPTAASSTDSTVTSDETDPNRPTLRRGKPPANSSASATAPNPPASKAVAPATAAKATATPGVASSPGKKDASLRSYSAISDAGNFETRSLLYAMSENERQNQAGQMQTLAMDAIHKFVSQRNAPAPPKTATITDYDLRAFDLDYSNSPTLVLSGKLPVASPKALHGSVDYFVTVVARVDINGIAQKIFASVTDSNYLDAFPRMQLVDAVDADANGRGDLLFRQYSDNGINYALFRVYPYQMVKIFEGGSSL